MAEAARRQYNKLKMQTKAEIRQTIDQLLVGEFIVRVKYNMTELLVGWLFVFLLLYCVYFEGKLQAVDDEVGHLCTSSHFPR